MIPFPNKKYDVIYADPPWEVRRGPVWGKGGPSLLLPYKTMKLEDIMAMNVRSISARNAVLFMWVINKYIEDAYDIARAWGFEPSCLLTWCKPQHGLGIGGTFVQTTEHILFCRSGNLKLNGRVDRTWFEHGRLSHSTKPDMFRKMIERLTPEMSRIELFARDHFEGWDVWGDEV